VLIFGHHRASLIEIAKRLKVAPVVGGTSDKTVKKAVADFQSGKAKYLVAGIGVLGTGFDGLQHAASVVAFAEPAWVPGEMDQAVGRLRRIGACGAVVRVYYLTAAQSSDAYIYNTLAQKSEVISEVLGASVRV
jgi:SWI/SNF-related matrix-associated actin-dependent regulator 1 of chromatin subfamily A